MHQPPRILLVTEPGINGVFRHVEGLSHYLIRQGCEVHLAYSDRRGSPELVKLVAYIKDHGGTCLNLGVGNGPHPRDLSALYRLLRLAQKIKPDVIHGHSSKAGVLTRALSILGVPATYLYTPHAYYGLAPRPGGMVGFYNGIESTLGGVGRTINISEDERAFAISTLKIDPELCVAIHNPVDAEVFHPATPEEKLQQRRKLKIPDNAVVLGSMGRLAFQKDPATLYRAFAQARKQGADIYLLHAGRGDMREELDHLAQSLDINDRLLRAEYFHNAAEFHAAIDALIVTSRYEAGWPIVILESMACDLPVISGTGPGSRNIHQSGLSHCWTAAPEDVDGFARAIEAWVADRPQHRPSNHRAIAVERFNADKCFGDVLRTYGSTPSTVACTHGAS